MKRTLSPKELALAVGVSESSLKRWADAGEVSVTRTAGGHRRIAIEEAIRFIRTSDLELVRPDVLGIPDLERAATTGVTRGKEDELLRDHLEVGSTEAARGLILWMFLRGDSAAAICDGPVRGALEAIGEYWRRRRDGIMVEHRATDICLQALDQLRSLNQPREDALPIVGGGPSGDPYLLPSLMAASSLSLEGFHAINLGPDTPAETLAYAAEVHQAGVVWLSISAQSVTRASMEAYVQELLGHLKTMDSALIVGGRSAEKVRHLRDPHLHVGQSMAELVAFVKGRLGGEVSGR